jgi:hypothetical protein
MHRGSYPHRTALSCGSPQSCVEPSADPRTARVVSESKRTKKMAETERAKALREEAERLAELRRYL